MKINRVRFRPVLTPPAGYFPAINIVREGVFAMNHNIENATIFKSLHVRGNPLVLYNVWDAGSAQVVAEAGAKAIATGSWAVAAANGYQDGERFPLKMALHNLAQILDAVDLPVTIDLESGYGREPKRVADTVSRAIELGAVGLNLEDQIIDANSLYGINEQSMRIQAARRTADALGVPAFLNARTDVFMPAGPDLQIDLLVSDVLKRSKAYSDAGADGLFVPGLADETAIEKICTASSLPVNIMMSPNGPSRKRLSEQGVARISDGLGPYQSAMETIAVAAKSIYS